MLYVDFNCLKQHLPDAVDIIKQSGGVVILPHIMTSFRQIPNQSISSTLDLLYYLKSVGVDGVEPYHPSHLLSHADKLANLAYDAGLAVCAGSDSHQIIHGIGHFVRGKKPNHNIGLNLYAENIKKPAHSYFKSETLSLA